MPTVTVTATGAGSFTIPADVFSIDFEAWGGGGNCSDPIPSGGAGGGYIAARMAVTPGDVIYYTVGGAAGQSWFRRNTNSATNSWRANGGGKGTAVGSYANGNDGALIAGYSGGPSPGNFGSGGGSAGPLGNGLSGSDMMSQPGGAGNAGYGGAGGLNLNPGQSHVEGGGGGGWTMGGPNGGSGGAPGGGAGAGYGGGTAPGGRGQIRYSYKVTPLGGFMLMF